MLHCWLYLALAWYVNDVLLVVVLYTSIIRLTRNSVCNIQPKVLLQNVDEIEETGSVDRILYNAAGTSVNSDRN